MRKYGLVVAVLVAGLFAGQAMGTATFYLSTVTPQSGTVPTPGNPTLDLNVGDTATLYLWAQLASATSTAMGIDFVPANLAITAPVAVDVANPVVETDPEDPTNESAWVYRWNGVTIDNTEPAGFAALGGFNDPQGVNAVGLTSTKGATDPTRRGASSPFQFYVGSFTFQATAAGSTGIFLPINETLMIGNAGMIGTPAAPVLHFGINDDPLPVLVDVDQTNYLAQGTTSTVADATINVGVIPEPATLSLLALAGLALVRRR